MLSRVVGMLSKSCDKSAQAECYTNEDGHDLSVSAGHTAVLPLTSELGSRPSVRTSKHMKSFNVRVPSRILSLCGGGHLCIAHIGLLKALHDRNLLKYVKEVIGISAGALVGLMYVLGYTLPQIETLLYTIDLSMFTNIESDCAFSFYQTLCVNSGEMLDTFLRSLLEKKGFSETTTFAEFNTKTKFRCYATCLQTTNIQEFSARKTPNHSILFALRASMCLPVIFAPMKDPFTEYLYYDAALIHNMPFVFLSEEEKRHTLCVFFDIFGLSDLTHDITSVLTYAFKSFYNLRNVYYLKRYTDSIVRIPVDFTKFLDCNTKETKDELITMGYSTCMAFLDSIPKPGVRRYSIS